jgi:saccharopine dehydrogenase-like NADP-dependent oxidoreductase
MPQRIVVLGAGLIGKTVALELGKNHEVIAVDSDQLRLDSMQEKGVKTACGDILQSQFLENVLAETDLVIGAVPGKIGFRTLKTVLKTGKNVVDISFFPEDPFTLHDLSLEKQCFAVVDCGVAPGLGNLLLGNCLRDMEVEAYRCYVGGLPVVRKLPHQYKAVFSPADVIEEYTRTVRFRKNGEIQLAEALSEPEMIEIEGMDTLEAFNTDGLRTLIDTTRIPNLVEKTLRYPGTLAYLKLLKESGFFSEAPLMLNGQSVKPVELTSALLFPQWELKAGEEDLTVLRVEIKGAKNGQTQEIIYELLDRYDRQNQVTSMARTTAYTCTAIAEFVLQQKLSPGIHAPEQAGSDQNLFNFVIDYLSERNIKINRKCRNVT